ncbi:MAG TPA: peptidoglycan DD-metalloendopeptidase family protein [Hyphomonadaceae bacterium]|jgi:septal ring factor EnvC (AmiA/AmiB activator)|nr:peptidoglycan DD-metalloendopeptidase family protein [Hyphomonadaceae bacterium]
MMRALAIVLCLMASPAVAQQSAKRDTYTQDDLKRVEAARDNALKRLRVLEKAAGAAAREASDIDADLLEAAADSTRREEAATSAETRLVSLSQDLDLARQRLTSDRKALDDLLAALMTFGSRRPPALAASPADTGAAVRAAILMSDAAPALNARAAQLKARIADLNRLTAETRTEQDKLTHEETALAARRDEITALAAEKRLSFASLATETAAARAESTRLGAEAETLRDLLDGLARAAPATPGLKPRMPTADTRTPTKPATKPSTKPTSPTAPSTAPGVASAKPVSPAAGVKVRGFGQAMPEGKAEGLTLSTRAGAQVIAPLDARVQYAGVFRTYGLMVILDVGGDVLVIVSGLDALYPQAGQWVLAGEPIGRMADRPLSDRQVSDRQAADRKTPSPELYLEVRRKGEPIDPEKWLARGA